MSRISRLRHVRELYTKGDVVELIDGTPLWVRALNPFEQDQARSEAQIARARMMLAIKQDSESGERARVRAFFFESGIDGATEILVNAKVADSLGKISDQLRFDPEWKERLDILARGQESTAPLEGSEKELLEKLAGEYADEMRKRINDERDFHELLYAEGDEDKLWEDYLEIYSDRRGTEAAVAEHRVHQIMFGTYVCDGVKADEVWTHENCSGHTERLFLDPGEVRTTPEEVVAPVLAKLAELDMSLAEAKNSDRQGSSSDSSLLPSEPAESTPSTQIGIPSEPTGS